MRNDLTTRFLPSCLFRISCLDVANSAQLSPLFLNPFLILYAFFPECKGGYRLANSAPRHLPPDFFLTESFSCFSPYFSFHKDTSLIKRSHKNLTLARVLPQDLFSPPYFSFPPLDFPIRWELSNQPKFKASSNRPISSTFSQDYPFPLQGPLGTSFPVGPYAPAMSIKRFAQFEKIPRRKLWLKCPECLV